jgi:hypothetical protein
LEAESFSERKLYDAEVIEPCQVKISVIALGYGLDDRGFESRKGLGIFLFTTASSPDLGPTQPPIQWIPGALSPEVKRPGRGAVSPLTQYSFMVWRSGKTQDQLLPLSG